MQTDWTKKSLEIKLNCKQELREKKSTNLSQKISKAWETETAPPAGNDVNAFDENRNTFFFKSKLNWKQMPSHSILSNSVHITFVASSIHPDYFLPLFLKEHDKLNFLKFKFKKKLFTISFCFLFNCWIRLLAYISSVFIYSFLRN